MTGNRENENGIEHMTVINTPLGRFTTFSTSTMLSIVASVVLIVAIVLLFLYWRRRD